MNRIFPIKRAELVAELKEICQALGCGGFSPDMRQWHPERCQIIRKVVNGK